VRRLRLLLCLVPLLWGCAHYQADRRTIASAINVYTYAYTEYDQLCHNRQRDPEWKADPTCPSFEQAIANTRRAIAAADKAVAAKGESGFQMADLKSSVESLEKFINGARPDH